MNKFVELYKGSREEYPHLDRETIYRITTWTISESGTISDLKALIKYYNEENSRAGNTTK